MAQGFAIAVRLVDNATGPLQKLNRAIFGTESVAKQASDRSVKTAQAASDSVKRSAGVASETSRKASGRDLPLVRDALSKIRQQSKEVGESLVKAFTPLEGAATFGSIAGAIAALGGMTSNFMNVGTNLRLMSQSLGLNIVDLQNWRGAADLAGVGADAMTNSLQGVSRGIYMARNGLNPDMFRAAQQFGIDLNRGATDAEKAQNVLLQVSDKIRNDPLLKGNIQAQHTLLSVLGIDDKMLPLLQQGRVAIEQYVAEAKKHGYLTEQQAAGAQALMRAYTGLKMSIESTGYAIGAQIGQWLTPMLSAWSDWLDKLRSTGGLLGTVKKAFEDLATTNWAKVGEDIVHAILGDGKGWQATGSKMIDWLLKGFNSGIGDFNEFVNKMTPVLANLAKGFGQAFWGDISKAITDGIKNDPDLQALIKIFQFPQQVHDAIFGPSGPQEDLRDRPAPQSWPDFFHNINPFANWANGGRVGGAGGISGPTPTAPTPQSRAELSGIAGGETYGFKDPYHTLNGGGQFGGDQYPYWAGRAAGRYQFLAKTWDMEQRRLGLKDFSPESQDIAARDYAATTYSQATGGRNLEADLGAGTVDPRGRQALTGVWPGGFNSGFESRYKAALGQDKAPPQPATPIPAKPAVGANSAIPIAPVPSLVLPTFGLTVPPPTALPAATPPTQPQDQQGKAIPIPPRMPSEVPGKQSALDQNSMHHFILDIRGANSGVKYAMNRAEGPATTEVRVGYAMDNLS